VELLVGAIILFLSVGLALASARAVLWAVFCLMTPPVHTTADVPDGAATPI
jgi:multisubunit Na+/H+ antiporter MnhG subunit